MRLTLVNGFVWLKKLWNMHAIGESKLNYITQQPGVENLIFSDNRAQNFREGLDFRIINWFQLNEDN